MSDFVGVGKAFELFVPVEEFGGLDAVVGNEGGGCEAGGAIEPENVKEEDKIHFIGARKKRLFNKSKE